MSSFLEELPPDVLNRIADKLARNELPLGLRVTSKSLYQHFKACNIVRLYEPVPQHGFVAKWIAPGGQRFLTRRQKYQLVHATVKSGCLINLEAALQASHCTATDPSIFPNVADKLDLFAAAASSRQLHVCEWLLRNAWPWGDALAAAAQAGHVDICEWLLARECPWNWGAVCAAARGGHPNTANYLQCWPPQGALMYLKSLPYVDEYLRAVAEGCALDEVKSAIEILTELDSGQWMQHNFPKMQNKLVLAAAAGSPTPDWQAKVNWLKDLGCEVSPEICNAAARCPDAAKRLSWLRQQGFDIQPAAAAPAARVGNVPVLQYIIDGPLTRHTRRRDYGAAVEAAAQGGHLAALQVLHANGWTFNPTTSPKWRGLDEALRAAAGSGHLDVVAWLVQTAGLEVSKLHPEVLQAAAWSGNIQLMTWLMERGGVWSAWVWPAGAYGGCEAVLEWLAERGCPMPDTGMPYAEAAYYGDLATLACLRRLGVPLGPPGDAAPWLQRPCPLAARLWLVSAEAASPSD